MIGARAGARTPIVRSRFTLHGSRSTHHTPRSEPRAPADVLATLESGRLRRKLSTRPYSVAFRLTRSAA